MQPKSKPCVFLGYSTSQSAFQCYDHNTKKIFISRHVVFHESIFPFVSFSQPSLQSTNSYYTQWFSKPLSSVIDIPASAPIIIDSIFQPVHIFEEQHIPTMTSLTSTTH